MTFTLPDLRARAQRVAAVVGASAILFVQDASALDIEGALKTGVATKPGFASATTPYGFGFGGRLGITVLHVYLGATAIAYFGGSYEAPSQAVGHVKIGWSSTLIGAEFGPTLQPSEHLILRPQLGIGDASFTVTIDGSPLESANTGYKFPDHGDHLYFEPSLDVLVPIRQFFAGVDGGALVTVMGHPYPAFSGHFQAGLFF